jgi:hypothetical protein
MRTGENLFKRGRILLFLKKKKQKDFWFLGRLGLRDSRLAGFSGKFLFNTISWLGACLIGLALGGGDAI